MSINMYLRVPVGLEIPKLADFAKRCEDAGFAGIGIHDHQDAGRDVFSALTAVALNTSTLKLFPAVTNPVTRHPMVLASLANSLEEVAPNRTLVMIGSGDMAVTHIGKQKATIDELSDATTVVRQLLAGDSLTFGASRDEHLIYTPRTPVPVYIAATGPKTLKLAGQVGDGAFLWTGFSEEAVQITRQIIADGLETAGRSEKQLPIVAVAPIRIEKDIPTACSWMSGWLAADCGLPGTLGNRMASHHGPYMGSSRQKLSDAALGKTTAVEDLQALGDFIGLFGPPEYIAERILQIHEERGISDIFLMSAHHKDTQYVMPQAELDAFSKIIFKRIS